MKGACPNHFNALSFREGPAEDIRDDVVIACPENGDGLVHELRIDQRTVGADPHEGIHFVLAKDFQKPCRYILQRSTLARPFFFLTVLDDGIVASLDRSRNKKRIDLFAFLEALDEVLKHRCSRDLAKDLSGESP